MSPERRSPTRHEPEHLIEDRVVNWIDYEILVLLNSVSRKSWVFDYLVNFFAMSHLFKGGLMMAALWWFWFAAHGRKKMYRESVASLAAGSLITIAIARVLALVVPFRQRPLQVAELHFVPPYTLSPDLLDTWNAFPSDHAALFFTLATGIYLMSKRAGRMALGYVVVVICLPRIYLGLHYPSDIGAGALIGIAVALLANKRAMRDSVGGKIVGWSNRWPSWFYASSFILCYEIARLFDDVRAVGVLVSQILRFASG